MNITIGGIHIESGEQRCVMIPIPHLYHKEPVLMPTYVLCGKHQGPILLVTAAIHGDEINGIEIVRRLLKIKFLKSLNGTLICVPVVNVYGFIYQSRYLMDRRDLNRSFPGRSSGSIAARLAKLLVTELISKASHIIDLHTGALHRTNLPQIRASLVDNETLRLAKAFNAPVIIDSRERDGSLRQIAADLKKSLLLYEAGEALRFDEASIKLGVRGIINTMCALKMLRNEYSSSYKSKNNPTVVTSTHWVRAEESGNLHTKKRLGTLVKKGEIIGTISNPFDLSITEVKSPYKGILIGYCKLPPVHEGQALFHIALLENPIDNHIQINPLEDLMPKDIATFFPEEL
jgi:predicted deacylase